MIKPSQAPNILFLISDQQRTETLGHIGRTPCRTPHIDRLAAKGVSFNRCVTPSPLCGPARCGIFTGRYPHQVRGEKEASSGRRPPGMYGQYKKSDGVILDMLTNGYSVRDPMPLTGPLHDRGYHLDYVGKWHLGDDTLSQWFDRHDAHGFDQWPEGIERWGFFSDPRVVTKTEPRMSIPTPVVDDLPPERGVDAWIADVAIEHLKNRPRDQPFFLTCSFIGPHPPFKVPEPYFGMYDPKDIPEPPNFAPNERERRCNADNYYRRICRDFGTDWEPWKKAFAVYWGFCTLIDYQIGRILRALEEEGLTEETLVVFCSDHGEMLGQHGLWQKYEPYEEDLRVPLVLSAPWLPDGVRSDAAVSLLDIVPTILAQADAAQPAGMEGRDLGPALTGRVGGDPFDGRLLFSEHRALGAFHHTVDWRLVTDNRWKYVWNDGDLDELFDLETDPYETSNLIDLPVAVEAQMRMRAAMGAHMAASADPLMDRFTRS